MEGGILNHFRTHSLVPVDQPITEGIAINEAASCPFPAHQRGAILDSLRKKGTLNKEELLTVAALNSWKLVIGRFDQVLTKLSEEQLQKQIAPGRNRLFYLLGHLTAVHDRMLPLLGIGERLYPELDETYITNPDRALPDPVSASDLKKAWREVNTRLTAAFEGFTVSEWLERHGSVSEEDFAKDPSRNRLAVVIARTNHVSFHSGQAVLAS
jgi:hypothetical protein